MEDDRGRNDDEPLGPADAMMMRGEYLRRLRKLAEEDEAERCDGNGSTAEADRAGEGGDEVVAVGGEGRRVLRYESYLSHQRYYDDLKHVDIDFIDYGVVGPGVEEEVENCGGRLIIEQDKSQGKGGLCWDAAFILAEHMISHRQEWLPPFLEDTCARERRRPRLVELGSGTGLAGLIVAKAVPCHVFVTDLPELMGLLGRNVRRNFRGGAIMPSPSDCMGGYGCDGSQDRKVGEEEGGNGDGLFPSASFPRLKDAKGSVTARILRWGNDSDYGGAPFDVVFGADVVASLYDPVALAQTFHALSSSETTVFLSYKGRLTGPHEAFEAELESLFSKVEKMRPVSRNRNPDVWVLTATNKIG